ncbi:MAG: transcription termination/antitermination protein NusG [Planctomycetota bacterium]|jgi:transcriptional antiterminator NusG|nr:transcription termination/antitermination protein NusG [Planctomycetota bacterium]
MISESLNSEEVEPEVGEESIVSGESGSDDTSVEGMEASGGTFEEEQDASSEMEAADSHVEDADEETEESPAPVMPSMIKPEAGMEDELTHEWYVVKVANGREDTLSRKVERKLALSGLDKYVRNIAVPKQKIIEIKDGKKRVREQKLYQGYFFMECQLVDEIWYLLREVQGVGSFVGGGAVDKPMPMTPEEVRKLRDMMEQRESEVQPELKIDVKKNDAVKVKDGPFENFEGVVEEIQPKTGKLRVMVTIFGRDTPVDLEYWQVEKT